MKGKDKSQLAVLGQLGISSTKGYNEPVITTLLAKKETNVSLLPVLKPTPIPSL